MKPEAHVAAASGVLFSILSLIVIPLTQELGPPLGGSGEALARYYSTHKQGFLLGNYLGILAMGPGLLQLVLFVARLRRAKADDVIANLVLASGVIAYAVGTVDLVIFQSVPFVTADLSATYALGSLANVGFALFLLAGVPFLAASAWAILATGAYPRAFGVVTVLVAVTCLFASLGALWIEPAYLAAGGPITGAGFFAFFGWTFALALASLTSDRSDSAAPGSARP